MAEYVVTQTKWVQMEYQYIVDADSKEQAIEIAKNSEPVEWQELNDQKSEWVAEESTND